MTINTDTGALLGLRNWNEYNLNPLNEEQLEGKSGASSRGNSSSNSVY